MPKINKKKTINDLKTNTNIESKLKLIPSYKISDDGYSNIKITSINDHDKIITTEEQNIDIPKNCFIDLPKSSPLPMVEYSLVELIKIREYIIVSINNYRIEKPKIRELDEVLSLIDNYLIKNLLSNDFKKTLK